MMDSTTVRSATPWAVRDALTAAWTKAFKNFVIETDSRLTADLLNSISPLASYLPSLFQKCRTRLDREWAVKVVHNYREGNYSEDCQSKAACSSGVFCALIFSTRVFLCTFFGQ